MRLYEFAYSKKEIKELLGALRAQNITEPRPEMPDTPEFIESFLTAARKNTVTLNDITEYGNKLIKDVIEKI